ncbi:glycosyltransferase family 4 protein [Raoultella terrigena]|uniref:glycosyltransferase family 4 protein n=1 Tax=Raoultella terrigena TaxID=577 RepID=UPI0025B0BFC9|nr:glycosyltransferase family 4 protein [Raoultella terrigena]WJV40595.1 glycosyltransferase family 4 protein [Raoultella terrigena]
MIILHEYGEPSHYLGAVESKINDGEAVVYREFSTLRLFFKNLKSKKYSVAFKALKDFIYLACCFIFPSLLKNEVVIIGIAPFDFRVFYFNRILKKSYVIYHTSWMIWDGSKYPKESKYLDHISQKCWLIFLKKTVRSFAVVTETVKAQLIKNYEIEESKIKVVHHAFDNSIFNSNCERNNGHLNAIFVGRLVVEKGIDELLSLAKNNPDIDFYIIGRGPLEEKIRCIGNSESNVKFIGFVSDKYKLASYYQNANFIILPSKRNPVWEELFGIVLIEAMACGCIPLCTDHTGPKTILDGTVLYKNIFKETEFLTHANGVLKAYSEDSQLITSDQNAAIEIAGKYSKKEISIHWESVFNKLSINK